MPTDTQAIEIDVPLKHAFDFLAQPENLPKWAAGFAQSISKQDQDWLVQTPQGEVRMKYVTHRELGIIDYHISPAPGVTAIAHSRVVPSATGVVYVFTQEQGPGMPEEAFRKQVATLSRELKLLKSLLEVGSCA